MFCWNLLSDCLVFLESRGVHFGAHFANDTAPRKSTQGVKDNLHHVTRCREVLLCKDSIGPLNLLRNFAISRLRRRVRFASRCHDSTNALYSLCDFATPSLISICFATSRRRRSQVASRCLIQLVLNNGAPCVVCTEKCL